MNKYNPDLIPTVSEMLSSGQSITQVCGAIGISRVTFYKWLNDPSKPEFQEAVEIGLAKGESKYEQKLLDIVDGTNKCTRAQLTSLIYLMKCRYKERWLEKQEIDAKIEHTSNVSNLTEKELDSQLANLLTKKLKIIEKHDEDTVH